MKINYQHNLTKEETYERISKLISNLQEDADDTSDLKINWDSENTEMRYCIKVPKFNTSGKIVLKDRQFYLEGKLPLIAKPFSRKIKEMIRKGLEDFFS